MRLQNLKAQFALLLGVIVLAAGAMALAGALVIRSELLDERVHALHIMLDAAHALVVAEAARSSDDPALAQRRALRLLAQMRFGKGGYVTVFDRHYTLLANAARPQMVGRDVRMNRTPDGVFQFQRLAAVAAAGGKGVVRFSWYRPGGHLPEPKIATARAYAPWGWVLSSGDYIDDINARFWGALRTFLLLALLVGAAVFVAVMLIMRSLRRSLGAEPAALAQRVQCMAAGDFAAFARGTARDGSVLASLHDMRGRVGGVLGQVHAASAVVGDAAAQIAQGNNELSQRTQEQAGNLDQTARSLKQFAVALEDTARHAVAAEQLATSARNIAQQGATRSNEASAAVAAIAESSVRIAAFVTQIDEIAAQTNLLALNAAIEAARAGEHGRGFAVVANEVRALAQRSADAAQQVNALIGESNQRVEQGVALTQEVGMAMETIASGISEAAARVAQIAAAAQVQSGEIGNVSSAVQRLDEMTQQNAAQVEEAAAASQALHDQASTLRQQVAYFRIETDAIHAEAAAEDRLTPGVSSSSAPPHLCHG